MKYDISTKQGILLCYESEYSSDYNGIYIGNNLFEDEVWGGTEEELFISTANLDLIRPLRMMGGCGGDSRNRTDKIVVLLVAGKGGPAYA